MSIVVRFTPTGLTAEQYDETIRAARGARGPPPDGLDYHVCFGSDGNLRVSEIWDSQEQFEAFGAPLMPILAESRASGSRAAPEPFQVHNIMKR